MNKCEKCGFLHYRTDPCRKPTKSTGLDPKPSEEGIKVTVAQEDALTSAPVDTNIVDRSSAEERSMVRNMGEVEGSIPSGHTKFNKKAWMRDYMREYMRKRRERTNGN